MTLAWYKVDKSEGGFLGSTKPGGGGDESVTAKLTQQVLMMNNHLTILREMCACVNYNPFKHQTI